MELFKNLSKLPKSFWVFFAATLINRAGSMVLLFLVIYLTRELDISPVAASFVLAIYGAGALISAPLSGRLGDRTDKFRLMYGSLILSGLLLILLPFLKSFFGVCLLTFCWAMVSESFRPASLAVMTDIVEAGHRKLAFALNRQAINLGLSIGPALGGFLVAVSYRAIFFIDAWTSILAGALLFFAFRRREVTSDGAAPPAPPDASRDDKKSGGVEWPSYKVSRLKLFYFLAAVMPVLAIFFQNRAAMALFVTQELHASEKYYGLLFTINTLLIIFFEVPLNHFISGWSYRFSLALGTMLIGLGFGLTMFVSTYPELALTVVLWTFGEMFLLPGITAYIADIAPLRLRGEFMGFYSMSITAAMSFGPWAGVAIMEGFGSKTLWAASFFAGCLSAAGLWAVISRNGPVHYQLELNENKPAEQSCG